ncbi:MAG: hypothetical protein MJ072_07130, partial [Clostridia bacterium]|nr:hypothetical protein [Clostridia bacterium]
VNGKKICGILIDTTFSGGMVSKSVIGAGLNVTNGISDEITDVAISMKEVKNEDFDIGSVIATLIYNTYRDYDDGEYEKNSYILGKKITLTDGKSTYTATCEGFNEDGSMNLDNGKRVYSGEVSVI